MYSRGFWEADQIEFLISETKSAQSALSKESWFIDIGANTGLYAVYFSKFGNVDRLVAFEPERKNLIELKFNLQINDIEQVEIYGIGLSDEERQATLYNADSKGRSTLEAPPDSANSQQVNVATFDQILQPSDKLLIVKMDIEGHELRAIRGMQKALTNNLAILQIESFYEKLPELEALCETIGYKRYHSFGEDHYFKNF